MHGWDREYLNKQLRFIAAYIEDLILLRFEWVCRSISLSEWGKMARDRKHTANTMYKCINTAKFYVFSDYDIESPWLERNDFIVYFCG